MDRFQAIIIQILIPFSQEILLYTLHIFTSIMTLIHRITYFDHRHNFYEDPIIDFCTLRIQQSLHNSNLYNSNVSFSQTIILVPSKLLQAIFSLYNSNVSLTRKILVPLEISSYRDPTVSLLKLHFATKPQYGSKYIENFGYFHVFQNLKFGCYRIFQFGRGLQTFRLYSEPCY